MTPILPTKIARCIGLLLMGTLLTLEAQAQAHIKNQRISQRDTSIVNISPQYAQKVSWWDSGNGFVCKIWIDNQCYLTRYDTQGTYIETLIAREWNDDSKLWSAFQDSEYKFRKVVSYWEVWDEGKTGYYLELMDNKNQMSTLWADSARKFTTVPVNKPRKK